MVQMTECADSMTDEEVSETASCMLGSTTGPILIDVPKPSRAWLVLVCAASFFVTFVVDGLMFSFGVLLLELLEYFGESKAKTSLVGSLFFGTCMMVGPLVSFLLEHFSCRQVVIAGSLLSCASFSLSIFSHNVETLIVLYGVCGGIGVGLMYLTSIIVVGLYFNESRALATGIAVSGSGLGTCALSFLIDPLVTEYGWKGCILIIAGLLLQCTVCGVIFRPLVKGSSKPSLWARLLDKLKMICGGRKGPKHVYLTDTKSHNSTNGIQFTPMLVNNMDKDVRLLHPAISRVKLDDFPNNVGLSQSHDNINMKLQIPKRLCKSHNNVIDNAVNADDIGARIVQGYIHPLCRKDIFYSGSIMNLPEFQQVGDMNQFLARMAAPVSENLQSTGDDSHKDNSPCTCPRGILLLKDKKFVLILITMALWTAQVTVLMFLPDLVVSRGISRQKAGLLVSLSGLSNTVGRLASGFLANTGRVHSMVLNACALILAGCITAAFPMAESYGIFIFLSLGFGVCMGSYISLRTIVLVDILGIEMLTQTFGIVAMAQGICFMVSAPISGAVYDHTQSFTPSFCMVAVFYALAGVISFAVLYIHKREQKMKHIKHHSGTNDNTE